ncbi:MAG: hypothetical protein ACYDHT_11135, partial [Solirubrobacteraceae bacterium]
APSVGSPTASNVAEQAATLAAPVGANSQATEYFFQYGPTGEYGSQTATASAGAGASPVVVSASASGLSPSTSYHFRAVATNASGTTYGPDQTFTTASAPTAETLAATGATLTEGTLHGSVNPRGQATTYHFDWGTTSSYGSHTPIADASVGSDGSEHAVEQALGELTPDTTYHFRVVASNCGGCTEGTTDGPDRIFTTAPAPLAVTEAAQAVQQSTATLAGTVNPEGASTTYHFDWGATLAYGNQAPAVDGAVGSDNADHSFSQALSDLAPATTYHYRIVASDCEGCASGTTYGSDATFTTATLEASRSTPSTVASSPNLRGPLPLTVAPPSLGRTALAGAVSGVVLVRVPGSTALVPLGATQNIPIGSVIDARQGVVRLTTAVNTAGKLQSATLWHGAFAVAQSPGRGMTTFALPHPSACSARAAQADSSTAGAARAKPSPPTLWAKDNHGQYSTRGQNSVATVRGTYWQTTNRCDGTLTTVKQGLVSVRDLHRHRTVLVRAGHSYLAKR